MRIDYRITIDFTNDHEIVCLKEITAGYVHTTLKLFSTI